MPSEKVSKEAVDYGPGAKHRKCALCSMFRAPHACTLVAGHIDPQYVCDRFVRRLEDD
jgi:LSD1 subclass zinc finger protein